MFTTNVRQSNAIPQSFNRYAYSQNDPVNFTDPSGLDSCYQPPGAGQATCWQGGPAGPPSIGGGISSDMHQGEVLHQLFAGNAMQGLGYGIPSASCSREQGCFIRGWATITENGVTYDRIDYYYPGGPNGALPLTMGGPMPREGVRMEDEMPFQMAAGGAIGRALSGIWGRIAGALFARGAADAASTGLGDLTAAEVGRIQGVVDAAGRPLEVVGSAAKGIRRGIGSDLPIGKGIGTRSDIDYLKRVCKLSSVSNQSRC